VLCTFTYTHLYMFITIHATLSKSSLSDKRRYKSHKNTKYTELVKYKDVIKISHRVLKWCIISIMYFYNHIISLYQKLFPLDPQKLLITLGNTILAHERFILFLT